MRETGQWNLGAIGEVRVIIDVFSHVAVGHMWAPGERILNHVWLFNCSGTCSQDDEPPAMPDVNILHDLYDVPDQIADIAIELDEAAEQCWFSWGGRQRALLCADKPIGFSRMLQASNGLAQVWRPVPVTPEDRQVKR